MSAVSNGQSVPCGTSESGSNDTIEEIVEAIGTLVRHALVAQHRRAEASSPEPWVTLGDAAQYADVSEDTLRGWVASGVLKVGRVGRVVRVRRSEIDRVLLAKDGTNADSEEEGEAPDTRAREILKELKGGKRG